MKRLAAIALLLLLAGHAAAEGARLELSCALMQSCAPEGICETAPGTPADFTIAPEGVDANGMGRYVVATDGTDAQAAGLSPVGPFAWTDADGARLSLVLTSERTALLTQQPADAATAPFVDFLICEITL
ncbi:hypothetical protein [Flavimaricola marinus]|uniref:Uncharacterized protein n=1 Tax=Flavimaricola marinus TaxID=1819565 RepID=A0A238LCI4_9RHOB|nr:hypothetical protein [Flavimaricola marinus]SMY07399.1 hypothetical protein LOM8899_01534 [Flavimaricola marinus]